MIEEGGEGRRKKENLDKRQEGKSEDKPERVARGGVGGAEGGVGPLGGQERRRAERAFFRGGGGGGNATQSGPSCCGNVMETPKKLADGGGRHRHHQRGNRGVWGGNRN